MKTLARATLLGLLMLVGFGSSANAQISFGFRIGEPPAPRAYYVAPQPDPRYVWVEGYWYPDNHSRWRWHDGYWTQPPYEGAYWVDPYWTGGRFYAGYWSGGRGRFEHRHGWDRDRWRDYRRWR